MNTNTSAKLIVDSLECKGSAYLPSIFTSRFDDTVGEQVTSSTGNPNTNYCGEYALKTTQTNASYRHLRFSFMKTGFYGNTNINLSHVQFNKCETAIKLDSGISATVYNGLFWDNKKAFDGGTMWGEHLTLHQIDYLGTNSNVLLLMNSLTIQVTNAGADTAVTLSNCRTNASGSTVFTNLGAARHYLADSPPAGYRDAGTTSINATLLADLRTLTTYAPQALTNTIISVNTTWSNTVARDTNALDLGYHYPPIDRAVCQVSVTNATLTLTNGVVVASFGTNVGLILQGNSSLISEGSPTNLNRMIRYQGVMEEAMHWAGTNYYTAWTDWYESQWASLISLRFTDWAAPAGVGNHLQAITVTNTVIRDCLWHNGWLDWVQPSIVTGSQWFSLTNNLFVRTSLGVGSQGDIAYPPTYVHVHNNLFYGGNEIAFNNEQAFEDPVDSAHWHVRNNLFNGPELTVLGVSNHSHNCYVDIAPMPDSSGGDITLSSFTYTNGPLGRWYHGLTNLTDMGSQSATNAGLYHFTTRNGVPSPREGNSLVDIGFHYMAVADTNNTLFDTDLDGIPDYLDSDWYLSTDTDGDGVSDAVEASHGTTTNSADSVLPLRLAKWSFEELSNNQTGTYHSTSNQPPLASSSPALGSGILYLNKAVSFNAAGDRLIYREIETNGFANFSLRRGSVMFWFKATPSSGITARLLEIGTRGDTNNGYWGFYLNTNMFFESYTNGSGGTNLTVSANGLTNGNWHHIALTWHTNYAVLWTNGVMAQSNVAATAYPGPAVRREGFSLGNSADGANPINGAFDELSSFNYPLSESEITNHFYYTRPFSQIPRLALWLNDSLSSMITGNPNPNTISNWTDVSGVSGVSFRQMAMGAAAIAKQPGRFTNVVNGHAVARFDGLTNILNRQNGFSLGTLTEAEAFVVLKSDRSLGVDNPGFWQMSPSDTAYYPKANGSLQDSFGCANGSGRRFNLGVPPDVTILTNFHLYSPVLRTNSWSARLNGLLQFATRNADTGTITFGAFIGGQADEANRYFTGDIAEIAFFTNGISVADRFAIGAYMNYRFRLFTNTPAAPSNFSAKAVSTNQISLTWDGTQTSHSITYVLERREGQTGTAMIVSNVVDALSCFDSGLSSNTEYYYRLKVINYWGESTVLETSATTLNGAQPDLPLNKLGVWLRADGGVIQNTNSAVLVWMDQMGTRDASLLWNMTSGQVGVTNWMPSRAFAAINGRPAINFDGVDDFLHFTNQAAFWTNLTTGAELYMVLMTTNTNSSTQGFCDWGNGLAANIHRTRYPITNVLGQIESQDNFGSHILRTFNVTNNLTQAHLYRVNAKVNAWTNWVNTNLLFGITTTNAVAFPLSSIIGRSEGTSGGTFYHFNGKIAEILIFTNTVTSNENLTIQGYLTNKFNITW